MRGINYYHEPIGFIVRSPEQMDADMEKIASKYDAVKIYNDTTQQDKIRHALAACKAAKKHGLYVIFEELYTGTQLTSTTWDAWADGVINDFRFVYDFDCIDEFIVGNEMSLHVDGGSIDDYGLIDRIKLLVKECQNRSKDVLISYQEGWWKKDAWSTKKLDHLPKIYFTLYETLSDFQQNLKDVISPFSGKAAIGEWSTQSTLTDFGGNEVDWCEELRTRQLALDSSGIDHFYFCFRDTGPDNNGKGFGLFINSDEAPHPFWFA